jgi:hypothetical protein
MNMLALFPDVDPGAFLDDRIRIHPVRGETVRGLMPNRDCVVVVPTEQYICEGVYLIAENGWEGLARCERLFGGGGKVWVKRELPCGDREDILPAEWFAEHVIGFVVANIIVTNEVVLRRAVA